MSKEKFIKNSQLRRRFEQFRNKRTQKTMILQSESQSLVSKIRCFQELLKLSKKDTSVANKTNNKVSYTACNSHKNIGEKLPQVYLQENTELLAQKLEKMVYGVQGWNIHKNTHNHQHYQSEVQQNMHPLSKVKSNKFTKIHYKSAAISRIKQGKSINQYISQYPPQKIKRSLIKPKSTKGLRGSYSVNHLLSIATNTPEFTQLKQKITQYQSKAKNKYGISFEILKNNQQQQSKLTNKKQISSELTRVVSLTQIKKNPTNSYLKLIKQTIDSSVPSHFLGLIRSVSGKPKQFHPKDNPFNRYIRV